MKIKGVKRILLIFIVGMFLLSGISALDNQGTGTEGENFTFIQTCEDATYITLSTIQYPNRSVEIINTNMTSMGGGSYQYNFTDILTGRYDMTGISDGCTNTFATYFEVTPSGFINKLGFYIIILILSFGIIIFGYFIEDSWVVILGAFGLVLVGLFILLNGIDGMKDTAYTYSIAIITIMLGSYFGIKGALENIDL